LSCLKEGIFSLGAILHVTELFLLENVQVCDSNVMDLVLRHFWKSLLQE